MVGRVAGRAFGSEDHYIKEAQETEMSLAKAEHALFSCSFEQCRG